MNKGLDIQIRVFETDERGLVQFRVDGWGNNREKVFPFSFTKFQFIEGVTCVKLD